MLNNISEQIRQCRQHAEDCARKAAALPDGSVLKREFLNLEKYWLNLAESFQFGEQLTIFTKETKRRTSIRITPCLRGQAFDPETAKAIGNALVTTCEKLGVSGRDDTSIQLVAQRIIELAERGLKNPTALHLAALKEFKSDPQ